MSAHIINDLELVKVDIDEAVTLLLLLSLSGYLLESTEELLAVHKAGQRIVTGLILDDLRHLFDVGDVVKGNEPAVNADGCTDGRNRAGNAHAAPLIRQQIDVFKVEVFTLFDEREGDGRGELTILVEDGKSIFRDFEVVLLVQETFFPSYRE